MASVRRDQGGHALVRHLDAGKIAMASYAHGVETQFLQEVFTHIDTPEFLGLDPRVMGNARQKTRARRLVPGKAIFLGKVADILFGQVRHEQRTLDAKFVQCPAAWAVIVQVIPIGSVQEVGNPLAPGHCRKLGKKGALAEIATIGRVGAQFLGKGDCEHLMPDVYGRSRTPGFLDLRFRHVGGDACNRQDIVVFQNKPRGMEQKCAVEASRKGNRNALQGMQFTQQSLELFQLEAIETGHLFPYALCRSMQA